MLACPDCIAGRTARLLVVSDAFVLHLIYVVLPFAVLALIICAIARRLDREEEP